MSRAKAIIAKAVKAIVSHWPGGEITSPGDYEFTVKYRNI
jgi:hypothetical protein